MATQTTSGSSPLAVAALALMGDGVTVSDLADRFADAGASVDAETAEALLDELCALGLARVARDAPASRYFPTPFGQRLLATSYAGRTDQAELLAELERIRTDLVATIAHELRAPLTAVRTSVGLLLDPAIEPSAEQQRTMLETIDRNASRMQRVVGEILDLARFRVGAVQLQLRRFDAVELARSAIASVESLAAGRGQTVELKAPSRPVPVFGDYRRLEQALVNLLSNAEKYSPSGSAITVAVAPVGSDVSWTVTDHGTGIDAADRERLFERFFVAGHDRSTPSEGVGLGLPITLAIVQAHGGWIDVESEPGQGSRFTIVVPAVGPGEASE